MHVHGYVVQYFANVLKIRCNVHDGQVKGHLVDKGKQLDKPIFHGRWDEAVYADMPDGSQRLLWQVNPDPAVENRWGLSTFAMQTNEMTDGLKEKLPPTDSRLRPDLQQLERANYDKVACTSSAMLDSPQNLNTPQ